MTPPWKCNQKKQAWCDAMSLALNPDDDGMGLVMPTMARYRDRKPTFKVRPSYRAKKGRKGQIFYLNACPFCLARFNIDLQDEE